MSQVTTITFFRFEGFTNKFWAFSMMQFAHSKLNKVPNQEFYKLLGTGKEGFSPWPDFNTYAILQIWSNEVAAKDFFENSQLFKDYLGKSVEQYQLYLKNIISRGLWDNQNPFQKSNELTDVSNYAVITRATIKTRLIFKFWRFVPKSQKNLLSNKGLLFTKGIGEVPFKNMATFSLWKDLDSLNSFAYQTRGHVEAIGKTRDLKWYSEELFARFQPYRSIGSWFGENPLKEPPK